jgi:hypothetical protein
LVQTLIEGGFTVMNLYAALALAGPAYGIVFTIRDNGSSNSHSPTCTIPAAGTSASDTARAFSTANGDLLSIVTINTGGSTTIYPMMGITFWNPNNLSLQVSSSNVQVSGGSVKMTIGAPPLNLKVSSSNAQVSGGSVKMTIMAPALNLKVSSSNAQVSGGSVKITVGTPAGAGGALRSSPGMVTGVSL